VKDKKAIAKFKFTEIQADMILEMKVHELSKLKANEIQNSIVKLEKENKKYSAILNSDKKLLADIKEHLEEYKVKYGKPRKTQIVSNKSEFKEIVENYDVVIDENNYAKRVKTSGDGYAETDKLCIVTHDGGSYLVPVKSIPIGGNKDKGLALENFINGEKIIASFMPKAGEKIVVVDSENYGKIISADEFICSRKYLKSYIKTGEIILFKKLSNEKSLSFIGENGKSKSFKIAELPELIRTGKGRKIVQGKFIIKEIEMK
jgi:topoisomerase-4 subunit A